MVVGRGAAVVAVHQVHVVGVRAHDGDALDVLGERQDAVVLEEDHAFTCGLDGQLVVFLAGNHLRFEVLPRGHLVRVEHAQLEAAAEDRDEGVVEVVDGDQALLKGVAEVAEGTAALEVGAVLEGVGGGMHRILVGHVLAAVEVVVDGVAVGDHQAVIAPLVAEDVHEQAVAHRAGNALVALVRAHHFADVTLDHQGLEGGEVGLPEVAHGHGHVHAVAERFRTAVHGVVLGAGVGLIVLAGLLLHAQDGLEADDRGQVRVLARGLLAASPARVAEDVDVRAPEGQFRVAGIVPGLVVHVPFPLGTVPVGARLVGDGGIDLIDLLRVEGGGHADGLRIHGVAVGADAVAGLAPPVVGRDAEAVHGNGLVHQQADLLLRGQEREEVLDPLLHFQGRILERILVRGFGTAGRKADDRGEKGQEKLFHNHLVIDKVQVTDFPSVILSISNQISEEFSPRRGPVPAAGPKNGRGGSCRGHRSRGRSGSPSRWRCWR